MPKGIADATTKIYQQLEALPQEDRLRAVRAALTMLGEPIADEPRPRPDPPEESDESTDGFSDKATAWIKKNGVQQAELEEVFHSEGGKVELIIGKAIGRSKRAQTVNTYILTGVAAFLETGNSEFSDEAARGYCQHLGCYDSPNHSNYVKAFGNRIAGSKTSGWKLTAPGLAAAVGLIRQDEEEDE
jgi:hypothetical protein